MTEHPRGVCRVCGRDMQLRKDGTLRHHGGRIYVDWRTGHDLREYKCDGAYRPPATDNERTD